MFILVIAIICSIALSFAMIRWFAPPAAQAAVEPAQDNDAVIMVIVSVVALVIVWIATAIKKVNNRDDRNE